MAKLSGKPRELHNLTWFADQERGVNDATSYHEYAGP
jgi:hypothetical protein